MQKVRLNFFEKEEQQGYSVVLQMPIKEDTTIGEVINKAYKHRDIWEKIADIDNRKWIEYLN